MRTFDGKFISKKDIQAILRTKNSTNYFKLYKKIFGEIDTVNMCNFVKEYAPTKEIKREAYNLCCRASHRFKRSFYDQVYAESKHGHYEPLEKQYIVDALKEYCEKPESPYSKVPMYGYTHLYFCSPKYGHSDYNKWRAIPIKGNEKFCETLISYAKKYFKDLMD